LFALITEAVKNATNPDRRLRRRHPVTLDRVPVISNHLFGVMAGLI